MADEKLKLKELPISMDDYLDYQYASRGQTKCLIDLVYKFADMPTKVLRWEVQHLDHLLVLKYWTLIQTMFLKHNEMLEERIKEFANTNVPEKYLDESIKKGNVPSVFHGLDFGMLDE